MSISRCYDTDTFNGLPTKVKKLIKEELAKKNPEIFKMNEAIDKYYKGKRGQATEAADSFNKSLTYIKERVIPNVRDKNGKISTFAVVDAIDNIVGEVTGSAVGKMDFIKNKGDMNKNFLYTEVHKLAYHDDPAVRTVFDEFLKGNKYDKDIWVHIESGGKEGQLNNAVRTVADELKKVSDLQYNMKKLNGFVNMELRENYLVKHSHAADKITADRAGWEKMARETIDFEQSFGFTTEGQINTALKKWYGEMESGAGKGIPNITDADRGVVFKSKDVEYDYFAKYGMGDNLWQKMDVDIRRTANDSAIAGKLGKNWGESLDRIINFVEKEYPGRLPERVVDRVYKQMNYMAGKLDRASYRSNNIAKGFRIYKGLLRMAMLGRSGLSALLDIASIATKSNMNTGDNRLGALFKSVGYSVKNLSPGNKKRFLERFKIVLEMERHNIITKYGGAEDAGAYAMHGVEKATAHGSNLVMKISGADTIGNSIREAAVEMGAKDLENIFQSSSRNFNQQTLLKNLGIDDADISRLNKHMGTEIDLAKAEIELKKLKGPEKVALAKSIEKVHTFLMDQYNTASSIGSLKSKAMLGGLQESGHWGSEMKSLLGTFRAPLLDTFRNISENFRMRGMQGGAMGKASQAAFTAYILAEATALGMAIEGLRKYSATGMGGTFSEEGGDKWDEYWEGLMEDPEAQSKAAFEGVMATGALSLGGDILGGGFLYGGSKAVDRFLGPGIGKPVEFLDAGTADMMKLYDGKLDMGNSQLLNKAQKMIPFQNHYFVDPMMGEILNEARGK